MKECTSAKQLNLETLHTQYTPEDYCKARAILSCFALFFPARYRVKVLCMTSKTMSNNPDIRKELIDNFETFTTWDNIKAITTTYTSGKANIKDKLYFFIEDEGTPLVGLELFQIFSLMLSNDFDLVYRAKLISTLRDLRVVLKDNIDYSCAVKILDEYIEKTYNFYCEVTSHVGKKINFQSEDTLGSLLVDRYFKEDDDDDTIKEDGIRNAIQSVEQRFICAKTSVIDFWDIMGFVSTDMQISFLGKIYDGLKNLAQQPQKKDWCVFNFYGEDDTIAYFELDPKEEDGKIINYSYSKFCTKTNFINMFEGVNETKPYRVEITQAQYIVNFVKALHDYSGNANLDKQMSFRDLVVFVTAKDPYSAKRVSENSFRRYSAKKENNKKIKEEYLTIIRNAAKYAKSKNDI